MSAVFNILTLPLLAIDALMRQMNDVEFIETSKVNETTKWTAKHTAATRKPSLLRANFSSLFPVLEFESATEGKMIIGDHTTRNNTVKHVFQRFGKKNPIASQYPSRILNFSGDCTEAILEWTRHMVELFKIPLTLVSLSSNPHAEPGTFEKIMENLPLSEGLYVCDTDDYTTEQVNMLMERAMKSQRVFIRFQNCKGPSKVDFTESDFNDFSVLDAGWVKLDHILSARFKRFFVNGSTVSSEDVNVIIKMWKEGWNPKMREFMTVSKANYHQPTILKDLGATYNAAWRQFEVQNFCPETFAKPSSMSTVDKGGWEIRRESDGHLARIEISHDSVIVYVWTPEELAAMELAN